jgi:cell wall-associated NlpC family hydrolase
MRRALAALALAASLTLASASPGHAAPQRPATHAHYVTGWTIAQTALSRVGDPYVMYGYGPYAFNCVGLVSWSYGVNGVSVPANLWALWNNYQHVASWNLQPGDVVLFSNTVWAGLSHAGIYIGGGKMVAADWYNTGVEVTSLAAWSWHYTGAVRILW